MFDVMVKGVLEASIPHWAVSAYPAGHLHPKTVAGEEHRRRKVPALACCHPGAVHVDLPDQPAVTVTPQPGGGCAASVRSQASLPVSVSQTANAVFGTRLSRRAPGQCLLVPADPEEPRTRQRRTPRSRRSRGVAATPTTPGPQPGVRRLIGNAMRNRGGDSSRALRCRSAAVLPGSM